MAKIIFLLSIISLCIYLTEQSHFLSKEYIDEINLVAKTWKAKQNFPPNTNIEQIKGLLGSLSDNENVIEDHLTSVKESDQSYVNFFHIPDTFDARSQWKNCRTIGQVRNQGNCANSWAFATSGAFADRLCIAKRGKFNQLISADDLTSCCAKCGSGCKFGRFLPINAWLHFKTFGAVTGGNYNTTNGCQPYRIAPCVFDEKGHNSCIGKPLENTRECAKVCYRNKTINYSTDHYRTKDAYYLHFWSTQKDVLMHGPIETTFIVYSDFLSYRSGVYERTPLAVPMGSQSVKLIGWGKENGVPYWLMVNSWGPQWGDKGLFKIRRGKNHCGVESSPTAGIPA